MDRALEAHGQSTSAQLLSLNDGHTLLPGLLQGGGGCTVSHPPHSEGFRGRRHHRHPFLLQACQALCTLLPMKSYRKPVAQFFPQLLMALLLQLFYSSSLRLTTGERPL